MLTNGGVDYLPNLRCVMLSQLSKDVERVMILNVISNRLINISMFAKVAIGGWGNEFGTKDATNVTLIHFHRCP
ncbi:MAG: hypothetical protein ACTS41_00365 [Candidatus Hodgkinia cicadicola]